MASATGELSVRSHERVSCVLPAEAWVGETCQEHVKLSGSATNAEGAVPVTVVDCSKGGLGLNSPVYFPRSCRLRVRLSIEGEGGAPAMVMEAVLTVRRVAMIDRTPTYYLGASFDDATGADSARLLAAARRSAGMGAARA